MTRHGFNERPARLATDDLSATELERLQALVTEAFGGPDEFTDEDWRHALGGIHFVLAHGENPVAHAAVVERKLHVGERPVRTGYVEAVATDRLNQRRGLGSRLMDAVGAYIRERFELGALSTGSPEFYERLGWHRWRGPTSVRTELGLVRTPDDDGGVLVLRTPTSPPLDLSAPISCDWRPGDVW
jgi:aminoglycoside 2'-N-acetyltransferase I